MFQIPEINIVRFDIEDVITTSDNSIAGDENYGGGVEE